MHACFIAAGYEEASLGEGQLSKIQQLKQREDGTRGSRGVTLTRKQVVQGNELYLPHGEFIDGQEERRSVAKKRKVRELWQQQVKRNVEEQLISILHSLESAVPMTAKSMP